MMAIMDTAKFYKPALELPPDWHDVVKEMALECNANLREMYWVALDLVTRMDREFLKKRARELRHLWEDSPEEMSKLLSTNWDGTKKKRKPGASA